MSGVVATTPRRTQAAILRAVLGQKYPKLALPTIASNFHMALTDVKAIINQHGYPRASAMEAAAIELEHDPAAASTAHPGPSGEISDQHTGETQAATDAAQAPDVLLVEVPVATLRPDPDNVRENANDDEIEDLAASIQEVGLMQPIVVRRAGDHLVVVAGHRRLAALKFLRWTDTKVLINTTIRPDDVIAAMLIENGQRRDLDPIEEARGLHRLKAQHDLTDADLARKVGRSQPFVSSRLALMSLSAAEQLQVRAGTMKLIEATNRGRMNSGRVRPKGQDKGWHLGPVHDLADRVKARCLRLQHPRGRTVGGMGCGECWESVIRADEREHNQVISAQLGKCVTCDNPMEKTA